MHAFRVLQYCIDQSIPGLNVMGQTAETVEPVPDLWPYAIDAPPPMELQHEMNSIFPDWIRAMESNQPLMEEGPTQVGTKGGIDPDSVDVAKLLHDLDSRGYGQALEAQVDGVVFGHPLAKDVTQALRMAAMYDLYIDLRLRSAPPAPAPRRFWKMPGPEWILLGLELGTVAGSAATDVLKSRAQKKRRRSVGELAELIRKNERAG
jgi:hypothetical protein